MPFKNILLVKPPGRRGLSFAMDIVPIGLEYIAAYIEDVVEEVHIVDMEKERRSFQRLLDLYRPDLVGITLSATDHSEGLHLAEIAKKSGIITVVGGYHPTGIPATTFDAAGNPIDPNYAGQLFGVGDFLVALITFIIVAFVIFLLVKVTKKWGIE